MAFDPEMLMPNPVPLRLSGAFPVLVSVTVCAADCVPDVCAANAREVGLKLAIGAGAAIVREKLAEEISLAGSVTCTVKVKVPDALGVPERTPVLELMVSQEGWPVMLHMYPVPLPPLAANVVLYATPT